jgi:hypothetical protein
MSRLRAIKLKWLKASLRSQMGKKHSSFASHRVVPDVKGEFDLYSFVQRLFDVTQ